MLTVLLIAAAVGVAFANGTNDNSKGVATLIASRIATFSHAILWANLTTFAGALAAIPMALFVSSALIKTFGGAGLLPSAFSVDEHYLLAVALGAAATILLATHFGLPISTTHSLVGALMGAGVIAIGPQHLVWSALEAKVVAPLLLSPVLASLVTLVLYPPINALRRKGGARTRLCLCASSATFPSWSVTDRWFSRRRDAR